MKLGTRPVGCGLVVGHHDRPKTATAFELDRVAMRIMADVATAREQRIRR